MVNYIIYCSCGAGFSDLLGVPVGLNEECKLPGMLTSTLPRQQWNDYYFLLSQGLTLFYEIKFTRIENCIQRWKQYMYVIQNTQIARQSAMLKVS